MSAPLEDVVSSAVLAAEAEIVNQLPMEPIAYGVVTFCILVAGLVVTYAFRNTASRH
ncbi:hypothetical protein [Jonesia denitrificans]|jgi:hypothetical protein|uniref:Uncharacterized protein n=1 Tax=Jonesia denitrificans (strain ATCC 14870 / DSM 20603 / BCRC 15368 / CIP 55.134 / JCM 11481 / NBRC 15587 / NCTC 10816 / Prevot 55134) TaxID=471856 RepID=C7R5L9_JONDD|nr:hypothetical protein [Jonesia denitrificans]ACV09292.1 hypothetical protein Jden_1644 [Jonesia denitrificans DSM 20603]QXB43993.1 hypothetical protein I6L70_03750 [Jonesia denitrificans]SQH21537.1 Uncharacterised protein [Jonesia denitrificans]